MTLFPFFINIENEHGIITGGGKHTLEKIQRLKPYHPKLTIYSTSFLPEIEEDKDLELVYREMIDQDLNMNTKFVILASDNHDENHRLSELCKEKKILVNVVDDQDYCDFIFPSLLPHGYLSIGICTNGASPATGVLLKRKIEEQIPDNIEEILVFLKGKRCEINQTILHKKKRFSFYYALSETCMNLNRPLNEEEFEQLLNDFNI